MATAIVTGECGSCVCNSVPPALAPVRSEGTAFVCPVSTGALTSGALRAMARSWSRSIVSSKRSAARSILFCRSGISPGSIRPRCRLVNVIAFSCGRLARTGRSVSSRIQFAIIPAEGCDTRFRKSPLICLSVPYSANPLTSAAADRLIPRALTVRITGVCVETARW